MTTKLKAGARPSSAEVVHGLEHVHFAFDAASFEATDFHAWVRSRFALPIDAHVRYVCDGREVVPSCSVLKAGVPMHIILPDPKSSTVKPAPLLYNAHLLLLVALNALAFAPHSALTGYISQMADAALSPVWRKVLTDAFVAALCWGTTYLFVRRIGNPENFPVRSAMSKFAADAIYGGMAAGATVVMRHLLLNQAR